MKQLRPYQIEGIEFLKANPQAGLFADMGLGKTATVLHALLDLPKPVLLIGPIRVIENVWRKEAKEWPATTGLSFSLVRGSKLARTQALRLETDIYLVNPEVMEDALLARSYGTLVIDESSLFKNQSTMRFRTLRKYLTKFQHRIILTGTPTPNSLMELWSQIFILDRGNRLDTSFNRFKSRFFQPLDYFGYKWGPLPGSEEIILKNVADIIFRVAAEGNLPPREKIDNIIEVTLPAGARKQYAELEHRALTILANDEAVSAATAAAALMKLRQVASGFVYDDLGVAHALHDEKIKAVQEVLDNTGSPVILVYQFIHELEALKKAFPQGQEFSTDLMDQWDKKEIPLLFLHPQSGGHGLNLQYGSHTMVIFSGSFSLEQMSQTKARIDRQGQAAPVVFHWLVAKDTVDELIMEVLDAKEKNQSNVLAQIKAYARARV